MTTARSLARRTCFTTLLVFAAAAVAVGVADPTLAQTSVKDNGQWTVIFRSADPSIWNSDINEGRNRFAKRLSLVPEGIKYLRMKIDAERFVIVGVTKDKIGKRIESGTIGWVGNNKFQWNGRHLGIYDKRWTDQIRGTVQIWPMSNRGIRGWGFGNRTKIDDRQGYSWAGKSLPKTVFEIAVKSGRLTTTERKALLTPEKVAASNEPAAKTRPSASKRSWTSADGKFKATAELVQVVGDQVSLKLAGGKVVKVPLQRLSRGDQDFIKKLMERPRPSVAVAPSKSPRAPAKLVTRQLGVLQSHAPSVRAVAFSPDGKWLASSNGKEVKVTDLKTGNVLNQKKIDYVQALAFSPSGKELVLCSLRQSVWNLRTDRIRELNRAVKSGEPDPTVHWLRNGLIFHAFGVAITPWDRAGDAMDPVRFEHSVRDWNMTDDGKLIAAGQEVGSEQFVVRLIDHESHTDRARFPVDGEVSSIAFSGDGALLAVGVSGKDMGKIQIYDVKSNSRLGAIPGKRHIRDLEFVPNSHLLIASQSYPGIIRIWNADNRKMLAEIKPEREQTINCLAVSDDGATLALGRDDGKIELWSPR